MSDNRLTLQELSDRSGVEVRTLRSWMQQGVVPGPDSVGRNASYAASTLTLVLAVKAMRTVFGMSLVDIRRDLMAADPARIESYAAMARTDGSTTVDEGEAPAIEPPAGSAAADYLRSLREAGKFGRPARGTPEPSKPVPAKAPPFEKRPWMGPPGSKRPLDKTAREEFEARAFEDGPVPDLTRGTGGRLSRLSRLVEELERLAGPRPPRRQTRADISLTIPITPELSLTVRGDHSPQEIARFEQVADLLRAILTGGPDRD